MKRTISLFTIFLLLIVLSGYSQDTIYINKALAEFKNENYVKAIDLLKQAESLNPNNPDVYYYLGYFCHYLAYDSRPLRGYNLEWSDLVVDYLSRAIELKPNYGDAYYFLGAEYGGRARNALYDRDISTCINEYKMGQEMGGNPDWLLEIGKNILRSCSPNAILFTAGDADVNAIHYLQFVENYRRDVSAFPAALLERPWFVLFMKEGIEDYIPSVPISWSEFEILNMRPYKWKTITVSIPFNKVDFSEYNIEPNDSVMNLTVNARLKTENRSYLDPGEAVLVDIIESNNWERPIHFSAFANHDPDYKKYFQLSGLTYKLLPIDVEKYGIPIDLKTTEEVLLNPKNYIGLNSFPNSDMPRTSHLLHGYRGLIVLLAQYYFNQNDITKGNYIIEKMQECIPVEILPYSENFEEWMYKMINTAKQKIN